jgi:hypothetical protein
MVAVGSSSAAVVEYSVDIENHLSGLGHVRQATSSRQKGSTLVIVALVLSNYASFAQNSLVVLPCTTIPHNNLRCSVL